MDRQRKIALHDGERTETSYFFDNMSCLQRIDEER